MKSNAINTAAVLVSILIAGYLGIWGQAILSPLFFAFLMSLLFLPFANFLERRLRFSRPLSSLCSFVVMLVAMSGIIYFFTVQLSSFVNDLPTLQQQGLASFYRLQRWVSITFNLDIGRQWTYINQAVEELFNLSGTILSFALNTFSSVGAFVMFSMLFFVFILNYRRTLYTFTLKVFHTRHTPKVRDITREIRIIIKQYINGLFIQVALVSLMTSAVLGILGIKYAVLLGVLTGFLNVIPYVGIILSGLFATIISLATGSNSALLVIAGYFVIHAIDANIILPFVIGSKVKINALFTFVGLLVGELYWGISGMFYSIPVLAILKIIFDRIDGLQACGILLGETPKRKKVSNSAELKTYTNYSETTNYPTSSNTSQAACTEDTD